MTLTDAIGHYLQDVAPNRLKPSTLYTAQSTLRDWRRKLGNKQLVDITTSDILTVRDAKKTPATQNRYVSVLSSVFREAIERDWINSNPCLRIQARRTNNSDIGKSIPKAHLDIILKYAKKDTVPPEFYTLLQILYNTGCRLGEALSLNDSDIDYKNATLIFLDTKNGKDRMIPIDSNFAEWLSKRELPHKPYRYHWNEAIKQTGTHYRPHDIRHTFITEKLMEGVSPLVLGKYVGHGSIAITQRYMHPDTEALRNQLNIG